MKTFAELWPLPAPEITIVTGPYGCGKSTFTLGTGASPERTLVIDFEKSQSSFAAQLPLKYVDMQAEMAKAYPNGYRMIDLYARVTRIVDEVPEGLYDVLILDNASPMEDAVTAYVEAHPSDFGHTPQQYNSMSGLKWGDVKVLYGQVLTRWGSKFKMIFIVVHLRDKWVGNQVQKDHFGKPIQEPKGKETLDQLSSLFVWLEHGPNGIPSAKVLKCRVDRKVWVPDPANAPADIPTKYLDPLNGEPGIVSVPVLPLRLPQCTWPAIRDYMRHPADLANPKPGEMPSEQQLSEDDRLKLRAMIADKEAEKAAVEKLKIEQTAGIPVRVTPIGASPVAPNAAKPVEAPAPKITLDDLVSKYSAEAIIVANEGKIPGTDDELAQVAKKLAGA